MKVTLNFSKFDVVTLRNLELTGESLLENLRDSQTMPFDTGNLQNDSTFVDSSEVKRGKVSIVSDTPYARRQYFHPEYNFRKDDNPHAGSLWFSPYISGDKKDFAQKTFAKKMKRS